MSVYRYRQFRKTLKDTPFKGKYMPYEWSGLPDTLPFRWMPFAEMFSEFSREIANSLNELTRYTHELTAWRALVAPLNSDQKMNVAHHFVSSLATLALNLPYVIRSRFIFATAHLSHQANMAKQKKAWIDDLPLDDEIYFALADKYGAPWKKYSKLKTSLERIGSKSYQAATGDFRNTYNHRFSPKVLIGQTQVVTRYVDSSTKNVTYGHGGRDPLSLETIVILLEEQCVRCYRAFENFQKLIKEQEAAIIASLPS